MARLTGLEPEPTDYPGITPGRAALGNALPFRTVIGPCRCIRNHARPRVCKSASALNGTLRQSFWVCTFPVVRQALALGCPGRLRTCNLRLNRAPLSRLSYWTRDCWRGRCRQTGLEKRELVLGDGV